jgi:hypothetical protein
MCDLNGTYAVRNRISVHWDAVLVFGLQVVAAGNATLDSWAIRHVTVTGGNQVQVDTIPCGGQAPDLCSTGSIIAFNQAFTQTIPNAIWGTINMPFSTLTTTITDPDPGEAFVTPVEANLIGFTLDSPMGAFPAAWDDPTLHWHGPDPASPPVVPPYVAPDQDGDNNPGVTSFITIGGTSSACGGLTYAGLPDPSNTTSTRIDRVYLGSRTLGGYNGTILTAPAAQFGTACGVMTGGLTGPSSGFPELKGHVRGCRLVGGAACVNATWQALDTQAAAAQQVTAASFAMVKVANPSVTCTTVRGMAYPCRNNADCSGGTPTCNVNTGVCQ